MGEMNFKNRGELVYETLKQEILDLRLKPGQMISENQFPALALHLSLICV